MDENNNIKKAPNVPPFLRYCSAIIPTAFDDSLSYYEALCALYKFLQDQIVTTINNNATVTQHYIDRQNELEALFEQLKEYVDNYFENLDVQEEINNKLDQMAEDGSLEALMEIWLSKDGFVNGGMHTPEYLFTRYIQSGTSTAFDATVPREMEGICKTGTNKIVVFYRPATVTDSSDVLVEEIDYTDNKNPLLLRHNTISNIRSGNSACFDPNTNFIYTWVKEGTFAVIDYTTLTFQETIVIPDISLASCIAYDNDDNKFYITEGRNVWELNITTLETELVFTRPNNDLKTALQGFEVRNGKFYFALNNPRSIVETDNTGEITRIMSLDDYDNAGHYSAYIADITFIDDNNILITPHMEGDYVEMTRAKSSYYINYVAQVNINGNNFEDTFVNGILQSKEIFVDTSLLADGLAYADGSSVHKLPMVSEYLNNKYKKAYDFRCTQTGTVTYYGTIILHDESLTLNGALECEGASIRGSSLTANSITTKTSPFYATGSTIRTPALKFGYNDNANKNSFTTSTLIVGSITDENDIAANAIYNLNNNSFRLDTNCFVLFSTNNIAGESSVTVGDISSYKKIRVIVTDSTSQQFEEEAIVPASGDIYMNFNRITASSTAFASIFTGRITIARYTGAITMDREYVVTVKPDPEITIAANARIKILRVEGYK